LKNYFVASGARYIKKLDTLMKLETTVFTDAIISATVESTGK